MKIAIFAVADPVADQLGGLGDDVQLIVVDLELGGCGCMALSIAKGWRLYVVWIALSSSAVGSLSAIQQKPERFSFSSTCSSSLISRTRFTFVVIICGDNGHAGLAGIRRPRCTAGRASPRSEPCLHVRIAA